MTAPDQADWYVMHQHDVVANVQDPQSPVVHERHSHSVAMGAHGDGRSWGNGEHEGVERTTWAELQATEAGRREVADRHRDAVVPGSGQPVEPRRIGPAPAGSTDG